MNPKNGIPVDEAGGALRQWGKLLPFYIVSREYDVYPQGEYEPAEFGADVVLVCAATSRRAKVLAVRAWRRGRHGEYRRDNRLMRYSDENPFSGLQAFAVASLGESVSGSSDLEERTTPQ